MSGEAEARSDLDLPGRQQELIDAVKAHRQAVRGRAVQRPPADAHRRSTRPRRRSSRPGSAASRPATRSPTSSSARSTRAASCRSRFPRNVGQVPIYYNHEPTGRPCDPTRSTTRATATSRRCAPLYEFGYGLSYTTFKVSNLRLLVDDDVRARHRSRRPSTSPTPARSPATTSCSSTSTTRSRASRSRSAACAASSG